MLKTLVTISLFAALNQLQAKRLFETDETGFAKSKAQYLIFTVTTQTHCHTDPVTASQKIQSLIKIVQEKVDVFVDKKIEDSLQVFPNQIYPFELTQYINNQTTRVCSGWSGSASLLVKMSDMGRAVELQETVLRLNSNEKTPRTDLIQLSAARPGILAERYEQLINLALKDAHVKAKRRAQVLAEDIDGHPTPLLKKVAATTQGSGAIAYDQTQLGTDSALSSLQTVSVNIHRRFTFELP